MRRKLTNRFRREVALDSVFDAGGRWIGFVIRAVDAKGNRSPYKEHHTLRIVPVAYTKTRRSIQLFRERWFRYLRNRKIGASNVIWRRDRRELEAAQRLTERRRQREA